MSATPSSSSLERAHDLRTYGPIGGDPLARLFFDRVTPGGVRVLALAEPVHRTPHGYLTAANALTAFEEAVLVAINAGIEPGLERAFTAANEAVRAANRLTVVNQRAFAGITAVAIQGQTATIGFVPPGQALLLQDGRLYGIPDLSSWSPNFMPAASTDGHEPLGLRCAVRPVYRRTTVREGDRMLLGASAVGRVLADRGVVPLADAPDVAVAEQLEAALAAAGVDDAYAAWFRFDADPCVVAARAERMQQVERLWKGQAPSTQPFAPVPVSADELTDPRYRRSHSMDRWHTRMIEASERVLGRHEPEALPYDAVRRPDVACAPMSLGRYRPARQRPVSAGLRGWLPRGLFPAVSRKGTLALLVAAAIVGSSAIGWNVREARASRSDRYLAQARSELDLAAGATGSVAFVHLGAAERALDAALDHGASAEEVASSQQELAASLDATSGLVRLADIQLLTRLPGGLDTASAHLVLAGGKLYVVAGSVYEVDTAGQRLMPVLEPGRRVDGIRAGAITAATVDGDALLVSDGENLFRLETGGVWTAAELARAEGSRVWDATATGAFKGNYYLLDADSAQIEKFAADDLTGDPVDWLDEPDPALGRAVDMVIDGRIYVLTADGTLTTYYKSEVEGGASLATEGDGGRFIGLAAGSDGRLYGLETGEERATLVRYDLKGGQIARYAPRTRWHQGYDAAGAGAMAQAVDFAVDAERGLLYFVTSDGLWRVALPAN